MGDEVPEKMKEVAAKEIFNLLKTDLKASAKGDIQKYAIAIAEGMATAASSGDEKREAHLMKQLRAVGALQKVRMNNRTAATLEKIVSVGMKMMIAAI